MALKGIKVLELAGLAPGPFCGMVLADFGASVIRIDKTDGDRLPISDVLGHGKRSIALNLKSEKGIEIFKKMSIESDVIIEPFRRGVMEQMKLGPDDIMTINKRIIYARLTGFGQRGSYADLAGHDINFLGLSGLLSLFGRRNEKPTPPANLAADFGGGGLICALGIILALFERTRSNTGQVIEASMVEGSAYLGSWFFRSRKYSVLWGNPRGCNMLDTGSHFYDTYETKDNKYMAVGCIEPKFYANLLDKLNLSYDELPQFAEFEANRKKLSKIFKTKTQEEWCSIFDNVDACVTPVLNMEAAPKHVHNQENETFNILENGSVVPNPAPKLSRTPGSSMGAQKNPKPGEHSTHILLELGYRQKEVDHFLKTKVVYQCTEQSKL